MALTKSFSADADKQTRRRHNGTDAAGCGDDRHMLVGNNPSSGGTGPTPEARIREWVVRPRAQVDYRSDTLAWNLSEGAVHVVRAGRAETLAYDALVVCSGATDRLLPVPGSDEPRPIGRA